MTSVWEASVLNQIAKEEFGFKNWAQLQKQWGLTAWDYEIERAVAIAQQKILNDINKLHKEYKSCQQCDLAIKQLKKRLQKQEAKTDPYAKRKWPKEWRDEEHFH